MKDILHAFRGPSLGMLERAERLPLAGACTLPVLQIEDIIGLKIQAGPSMMKLTEQEKQQLLQATARTASPRPPKARLLSPEDYFARLEQFALILPRRKKPVAFEGAHWKL